MFRSLARNPPSKHLFHGDVPAAALELAPAAAHGTTFGALQEAPLTIRKQNGHAGFTLRRFLKRRRNFPRQQLKQTSTNIDEGLGTGSSGLLYG
jgi:hypothetical protein